MNKRMGSFPTPPRRALCVCAFALLGIAALSVSVSGAATGSNTLKKEAHSISIRHDDAQTAMKVKATVYHGLADVSIRLVDAMIESKAKLREVLAPVGCEIPAVDFNLQFAVLTSGDPGAADIDVQELVFSKGKLEGAFTTAVLRGGSGNDDTRPFVLITIPRSALKR